MPWSDRRGGQLRPAVAELVMFGMRDVRRLRCTSRRCPASPTSATAVEVPAATVVSHGMALSTVAAPGPALPAAAETKTPASAASRNESSSGPKVSTLSPIRVVDDVDAVGDGHVDGRHEVDASPATWCRRPTRTGPCRPRCGRRGDTLEVADVDAVDRALNGSPAAVLAVCEPWPSKSRGDVYSPGLLAGRPAASKNCAPMTLLLQVTGWPGEPASQEPSTWRR